MCGKTKKKKTDEILSMFVIVICDLGLIKSNVLIIIPCTICENTQSGRTKIVQEKKFETRTMVKRSVLSSPKKNDAVNFYHWHKMKRKSQLTLLTFAKR